MNDRRARSEGRRTSGARGSAHATRTAPLARALSKLGVLTRSEAALAIRAGRVRVGADIVRDPATRVSVDARDVSLDGRPCRRSAWRTIVLHKPRGVLTTRADPSGRPTVYDVLGPAGEGLRPVGRLDRATSGLIVLTTDTELANWITDPAHRVSRVYVVTVRGRLDQARMASLTEGVDVGGDRLRASAVVLRKASVRESHATVELREGRNREVRRLFDFLGHEVTRLKRVALGGLSLGNLAPGQWRSLTPADVRRAFPGVRLHGFTAAQPPCR